MEKVGKLITDLPFVNFPESTIVIYFSGVYDLRLPVYSL